MTDRERYECIDPDLGEQLGQLEDPATDGRLRQRLLNHCESCAACRLQLEIDEKIVAGLRDGSLHADVRRGSGAWWPQILRGGGGLAMAAGLTLMLLLPPGSPEPQGVMRDESERPVVERPVAEEVVGSTPTVRWTPLEGVASYHVTVTSDDSSIRWSGRTTEPSLTIPRDAELPLGHRYRVLVKSVPTHRAPDGGLRTSFRTGRLDQIAVYRLQRGAPGLWGLVIAGLALAIAGFWRRRPMRGA